MLSISCIASMKEQGYNSPLYCNRLDYTWKGSFKITNSLLCFSKNQLLATSSEHKRACDSSAPSYTLSKCTLLTVLR